MERKSRSFVRIQRRKRDNAKPAPEPERSEAPPPAPEIHPHPGDDHTRIVVPREERMAPPSRDLNIELREVRYGTKTHGPYLRVVPKQQRLTRLRPGYLEATELGSQPTDRMGRILAGLRRIFIGSPIATSQAIHERLTKVKAMAVLSSDALSSSAYATEEILIVLLVAGSGTLTHALPISMVIVLLLAIVTLSYRQTIRAYPNGGGAYIVAQENLGLVPGLTAAGSLMVDYVLTVSVSVAAGVAAVTSAAPDLFDFRVPISIAIVLLITTANLRGIRESGNIFALPTYFFLVSMAIMIFVGLAKVILGDAPGSLGHAAPPHEQVAATSGLTLWLVLRAFSSGCAALTGVEAISNGVPAFKPPESQNARTTLTVMAALLAFLFLSITFLSSRYGLVPGEQQTVVSQLGREVLGHNVLYYAYQVGTALVLVLAANTSFADFPRLSAILARDRLMPHQFAFRGDRLAFSN
ncbi:MAG TPA: APC family permease, partial [Dehalococcoidia bacterium]|nr:APC family permease [Dehalococcoidia bacterium]